MFGFQVASKWLAVIWSNIMLVMLQNYANHEKKKIKHINSMFLINAHECSSHMLQYLKCSHSISGRTVHITLPKFNKKIFSLIVFLLFIWFIQTLNCFFFLATQRLVLVKYNVVSPFQWTQWNIIKLIEMNSMISITNNCPIIWYAYSIKCIRVFDGISLKALKTHFQYQLFWGYLFLLDWWGSTAILDHFILFFISTINFEDIF